MKKVTLLFLIALAFASCNSSTAKNENKTNSESVVPINEKKAEPVNNWVTDSTEDKMTNEFTYVTSIKSNEALKFGYGNASYARLVIRKKRKITDLYLTAKATQFHTEYGKEQSVLLKFDDEKAITVAYNEAGDGSSDVIFLNGSQKIIEKLKKSQKLIIEAEFYSEGIHQMEFDTHGFQWEH